MSNMAIKQCLQHFVDHVEVLKELDDYGDDGYTKEFQTLKQQSLLYRVEGIYTTQEGEREVNRRKNRYKDILPFDHTRVMLAELPGLLGSEYINANFIKIMAWHQPGAKTVSEPMMGVTGHASYIASQGPLPSTVNDFWRMVWDYRVLIVIMACNEYEGDKLKCARYWPPLREERSYGKVHVLFQHEESQTVQNFVVRRMRVWEGEDIRTIYQFHYIGWPDHGIPDVPSLLDLIAQVREYQPQHRPPLVVHCSAGCGRTGTICAIDYAWSVLKLGRLTESFSMYEIIGEMRRQRPSIVQAKDQYIAVHQAVQELFKRHLSMIDQHFYENIDKDGQPKIFDSMDNHNYENTPRHGELDEGPSESAQDVIAVYEDVSPVSRAVKNTVTNLINAKHMERPGDETPSPEPCKYADLPLRRMHRTQMRSLSQSCSYEPKNNIDSDPDSFLPQNSPLGANFDSNWQPIHRTKGVKLKLQNPPKKPRRKAQIKKSASEGDTPTDCLTDDLHQEGTSGESNPSTPHKTSAHLLPPQIARTVCIGADSEGDTDEDVAVSSSPVLPPSALLISQQDSPADVSDDSGENPFFHTNVGTQVRPRLVVQRVVEDEDSCTGDPVVQQRMPASQDTGVAAMDTSQTSAYSEGECAMSTSGLSESTHSGMDVCPSPPPPPPPLGSTSNTTTDSESSEHTSMGSREAAPDLVSDVTMFKRPPMPSPKPIRHAEDCPYACGHVCAGADSSSSETSAGSGPYSYAYIPDGPQRPMAGTLPVAPPRRKHGRSSSSRSSRSSGEYEHIGNPRRGSRDSMISDSEENAYAPVTSSRKNKADIVSNMRAAPPPPNVVPHRERQGSADGPVVPTKSHINYLDESDLSHSSDSLEANKESGMLALGKKIKQRVQQTFAPHMTTNNSSVPEGGRPLSSVYFKGYDISFPQRVSRPQGPKGGDSENPSVDISKHTSTDC